MPISVGYFRIRGPRVSRINSTTTLPPDSFGTFSVSGGFTVEYTGSGNFCVMNITGNKVITLIDEDRNHSDNLDITISGRNMEELVNAINQNSSYDANLVTSSGDDLAFLTDVVRQNIKNSPILVNYNTEKEYIIDVNKAGDIGNSSVNTKTEQFSYMGQLSRWMVDEGYIYDDIDVPIQSSGITQIGNEGVYLKFFPTLLSENNDVSNTVQFQEVELARSLDTEVNSITFQAAPILIDGTLEVLVNQELAVENEDYVISYGTRAEIEAQNKEPYNINSSNNNLKVRLNSDDIQNIYLPTGLLLAEDVVTSINNSSSGFSAEIITDEATNSTGFKVIHNRGTAYHQLRIENGSSNTVLGFQNGQSKRGEGNGEILFTKYVEDEDLTPKVGTKVDTLRLDAINQAGNNPFLGVATVSVELYENGLEKNKNIDYFVDESGTIQLTHDIEKEDLAGAILKLDNELFPPDYIIYDNGIPLIEGSNYNINPQGGWITLEESAFPGHVFTADYTNKNIGKIEGEVILGTPAILNASLASPFIFDLSNNIFEVSVNNKNIQQFVFDQNASADISEVVTTINETATGFVASSKENKLVLTSTASGPTVSLSIGNGSSNQTLGFDTGVSTSGRGAEGGERGLEVKNPPMDRTGFTAPEGGNTIIIKNNDVTSRYKENTIIKILNDYYQILSSTLVTEANLISSTPGPYTFLSDTNDVFVYELEGIEYSVTFTEGSGVGIEDVIDQINSISPDTAFIININGLEKIQLKSNSSILIKSGSANRTLGFDEGDLDTDNPDTVIVIAGFFKNTYVAPDMYTTIEQVPFNIDDSEKFEIPQNSNVIKLLGDQTQKFRSNILLRINTIYYYLVASSSFSNGITEIILKSKTDVPIFKDTQLEYTSLSILTEGQTALTTKYYPLIDRSFKLIKNNQILILNEDFQIDEGGSIELSEPIINGDEFRLDYFGRRFIDDNTNVLANYGFYNFLRKGSNIKVSLLANNPDNFYVNVLHGTNLLSKVIEDLQQRTQSSLNSSSGGFPTGEIPAQPNDGQGSDSHYFRLTDIRHKIEAALIAWRWYDERLSFFEKERQSINGYIVGAENGVLTESQLIYSGQNARPTRLLPQNDTRPAEERPEPLKLPCLFGENKNDAGSSSNGLTNNNLLYELQSEKNNYLNEKSKLNTLKTYSTTSDFLNSTGSLDLNGGEQIQLYVEIQSGGGSFQQRFVTVTFSPGTTSSTPISPGIYTPPSESDIRNDINNACTAAFGESVSPCSSHGGYVRLNASSTGKVKCCYVVQDNSLIGFGVGNEASIRSRHTLYTAGYVYSLTIPGNNSVAIDIQRHNADRDDENSLINTQINNLNGQMREWLSPYETSFDLAKEERSRAEFWENRNFLASEESNDFNNIKTGSGIYNSIDNTAVIDNRIIEIDNRISEIDDKINNLNLRLSEISDRLSQEGLYNPRYAWLNLLVNEENGYYASEQREILEEEKRKRQAATNVEAVNGLGNII